jgi:signal transduction histidine kinase
LAVLEAHTNSPAIRKAGRRTTKTRTILRDVTSERRLEEEKSAFIATISHELRTPMAAVYGAAQTLRHRECELTLGQRRDLLEMIATQAARLAQITEEVLLATELDRGDPSVEWDPVDVGNLACATVEAMRSQLPPSTELDVEVSPDVGSATGARDRIQRCSSTCSTMP